MPFLHKVDTRRVSIGDLIAAAPSNPNPRSTTGEAATQNLEREFEVVRQSFAPSAPSRLSAVFLAPLSKAGHRVIEETTSGSGTVRLAEVEIVQGGPPFCVHVGWYHECFQRRHTPDLTSVRSCAQAYWGQREFPAWPDGTELLFYGTLKVIRWVDDPLKLPP